MSLHCCILCYYTAQKSSLESAFESLSSTYEGIANSIKESVGIDDPSVVVKINTKDGTNIFSKTYKATK